jgi:hypothetical protein
MLDNYRDLIDELLGTPSTLRGLLDGVAQPPAEALTLIDELRARDESLLATLNTVLRTRDAVLQPLDTAADPAAAQADPAELLARFDQARGEVVSLLMNLTIKDWSATAIDSGGRETRVSDEVEDHVDFDEDHVERITGAVRG